MSDFITVYNDTITYPTIKEVGKALGKSERQVRRLAHSLRESGEYLVDRTNRCEVRVSNNNTHILIERPAYRTGEAVKSKNERILVISDLHFPFAHKDTFAFLDAIRTTYCPDRVVQIGDEVDNHGMSYHEHNPNLMSASKELEMARKDITRLETLFPQMDLVDSNHGSLYYRKATTHGIPAEAILPYNKLLGVGEGWKWHFDLTLQMSDGNYVYLHHGKSADVARLSRNMGMCAVQGHYHSKFKIEYWANPVGLYWGMQVGCMIDDTSLAFAYNKTTMDRPIVGSGIIINGQPKLIPMMLDKNGRWNKKLP
jgi:hypothetical protein